MYLTFLQSGSGSAVVVCAAAAVIVGLLLWAFAPAHRERLLILLVAGLLTALACAVYVLAVVVGWWTGGYFTISPLVQAAILLSASLLGWTLWLAGYQWLADHSGQPIQIYIAISLLLVLLVAIAHRMNIGRGQILVGPEMTVVVEAALAQIVLWIPVLVYEGLRRSFERIEPIP